MNEIAAAIVFSGAAKRESKAYTDEAVAAIRGGIHWKGYVDYYSSLPASPEEGDAYTVQYLGTSGTIPDGREFVWGRRYGTETYEWVEFGGADHGAVHYTADNGKTDAEKAQARANIDAVAKLASATPGALAALTATGELVDTGIIPGTCYGFHINGAESNPATAVTYLADAVGMTPAHMNYTTGQFDYGSWIDPFFMPRPCMLKSSGAVDYYLDPSDYTKKSDGVTASDVANTAYDGNAMMEWGRNNKRIWVKVVPDTDPKSGSVYIADFKKDNGFHAYSFINANGVLAEHFYTPIYNGSLISDKLRSISGQTVIQSKTAAQEIAYAQANGNGWFTEVLCDVQLINYLLILIGKTLNTQTAFGAGRIGYASGAMNLAETGLMNDKGLFWGQNLTNGTGTGVKVFGMEHWWGNQWRRFAGLINDNGTVKSKMCYGSEDGSTVQTYNTTGAGYVDAGITPGGTNGGYISESKFSAIGTMLPKTASGSASTHACDGLWFNNAQVDYAYRGGSCHYGLVAGAFYLYLHYAAGGAYWDIGASPSFKPLF